MDIKLCRTCDQQLPITEFYRRRNRGGYSAQCKTCAKNRVKTWRQTPEGAESARRAARKYSQTERGKRKKRDHAQTPERKNQLQRYKVSPDGKMAQRRANTSLVGKARHRRYFQSPKGKAAMLRKAHKRRPLVIQATVTADEWEEIQRKQKHRCIYCGQKLPLTMEHLIPISKGGQHIASNLAAACRPCNSRRSNHPNLLQLLATAAMSGS